MNSPSIVTRSSVTQPVASFVIRRSSQQTHRVTDDIRESIEELKHYRKKVFVARPK